VALPAKPRGGGGCGAHKAVRRRRFVKGCSFHHHHSVEGNAGEVIWPYKEAGGRWLLWSCDVLMVSSGSSDMHPAREASGTRAASF
jgi:hypothetical protein